MLTSRYAMWIGWGPDLTFLYNDSYAQMTLGPRHPWALGRPTQQVWSEIWEELHPRIESVLTRGIATWDEALLLFLERHGYPEETYHTFSYSPLPGDDGKIAGNFCVVTEDTERVIGARRLASVGLLASGLAIAKTERDVASAVEICINADARDLPVSLLYVYDDDAGVARRVAMTSIDGRHSAARLEFPLDHESPWPFTRLREVPESIVIEWAGEPLPPGPWALPPTRVLAMPITLQGQDRPYAVFIAGLNPHRPLDAAYRSFLDLFGGQIAAGLTSAKAYADERRRAEALAAVDRAKTAFFSNVSHEFRTPLTLMLGPTQDALAGDGVMGRDDLETVYRNELRLLRLVNSLLDFSRAEAGRTRASYEPVDLSRLTADVASTFRSAIERSGLRFAVDCPPIEQRVFVDRQMWEKVVLNLLSNAFKFTFEGRIRVALEPGAHDVTLVVEDTGVGIAESELPRVFERFHRIEGTRSRTHEGTGIGLALVQDIVALHGGEISATSKPGVGTTFRVRIPMGSAHLPADQVADSPAGELSPIVAAAFVAEAERWLEEPGSAVAAMSAADAADTRAHIVLADDNADMRDYVRRLLGTRWRVTTARNGRQALELMAHDAPDLVITDVMMPELDGFGLLKTIRENEVTRDVPVLMLSARAGEEQRLDGLQAGADDYLVKPFSARELLARVEMLLMRASIRAVENMQRRHLADIFRQAPAAIAIMRGPHHVFEHANPSYLELIGRRSVTGKGVREALPELAGQGIFELLDEVYRTGTPHVGEAARVFVERSAGRGPEERYFDFVYHPMRSAAGEIEGIAVVAFDVTDLVRARRDAEGASRAKDEFLAMLGHELRNPLAPILTALQLMRLRGGDAHEHERTVIERQTRHLVRLVDDLLDVSRIARGKIELRKERIELADGVAKAIEMASPLLEERSHRLTVNVPRGLLLDADPARLAQIVANLVTNAAKYTESGGRIFVEAEADADGGMLELRVADTGIGIEPDMLARIFEMFTQEPQSLDRASGGLGLGLTIVRNLVDLHGGTVEARSDGRGHGSTFIVRLPAAASVLVPIGASAPASGLPAAAPESPTVLVVDDNPDAAGMLASFVRTLGYRVELALDGPTALRVADRVSPGIALLDLGLPVMDGFEVARRLRGSPSHQGIRLIAITGYGQEADRERSRDAGFDAHLVKPVDLDQLGALIAELAPAQ
jgi:signal transduction histidine kinase/DNA-binding response OmpR family regulator